MPRACMATVVVFRPSDRSWWTATVDAGVLGDPDAESEAMTQHWLRRGVPVTSSQVRPPVLVLSCAKNVYSRGCATNSHYDAVDRSKNDAHMDCAHGIVIDRIDAMAKHT